jgi:hypothetical protein
MSSAFDLHRRHQPQMHAEETVNSLQKASASFPEFEADMGNNE